MDFFMSKGRQASRLRQRKFFLIRTFGFPEELLGGSLSIGSRRCGKIQCHCVKGEGHAQQVWRATVDGRRCSQHVPWEWSGSLEALHEQTQQYLNALNELLELNAELLALDFEERRREKVRANAKERKKRSTPTPSDRSP